MGEPDTRYAPHTSLPGAAEIAAPVGVAEVHRLRVVGRGRVGTALARAVREVTRALAAAQARPSPEAAA
jgi:hypothetical protein